MPLPLSVAHQPWERPPWPAADANVTPSVACQAGSSDVVCKNVMVLGPHEHCPRRRKRLCWECGTVTVRLPWPGSPGLVTAKALVHCYCRACLRGSWHLAPRSLGCPRFPRCHDGPVEVVQWNHQVLQGSDQESSHHSLVSARSSSRVDPGSGRVEAPVALVVPVAPGQWVSGQRHLVTCRGGGTWVRVSQCVRSFARHAQVSHSLQTHSHV